MTSKYRRHLSLAIDTPTEYRFCLVVRTEDNQETLGGGWVTIKKPFTDAQLAQAVEDACLKIANEGNDAFPRDVDTTGAIDVLSPSLRHRTSRVLRETVRARNVADYPSLGQRVRRR